MIRSFKCKDTDALFNDRSVRRFQGIEQVARRKLGMIDAAERLGDLRLPPASRLVVLRDYSKGRYGIRIDERYRIRFRWSDDGAENVEIVESRQGE